VSPANATDKTVTWSSDNTAVATVSTSGLVTAVSPGNATITVTTHDGAKTAACQVTVNGLKVAYLSGSKKVENTSVDSQSQLMVFPNPTSNGILFIKLVSVSESATINIFDLTGRMIYTRTFVNDSGIQQLYIPELKRGTYLVKVRQGKLNYYRKLIVE
jgi:hypothetical protein